jgi:hypothetical protein
MPFPFVKPLEGWLVDKLKEREADRNYITTLSPFAIMSSGAIVLKGKKSDQIKQLFETQQYGTDATTYYGCVITNTTDVAKLYQTGKTIVGFDLNGKEIVVEGETNRRVSTPIIESIQIDTDGGNNTLKTAQVKVRVFTLKQLEMFELFFLRPSMSVVLEYGWGTGVRNKSKEAIIGKHLFAKKKFEDYKTAYVDLFVPTLGDSTKGNYIKILKETEGEYDFMVGRVTSFNYSPTEDGTYDVTIEVSSGNELQLWPALKSAKDSIFTLKKNDKKITTYKSFIQKIAADFGRSDFESNVFKDDKIWKNEFFNYGVTNVEQKNTKASKTPYISMKVIIEIINNLRTFNTQKETISVNYEYDGKKIIPVNSNPMLISTDESVIFPGKLPKAELTPNTNVIILNGDKIDGRINEKSFNIDDSEIYNFTTGKPITPVKKKIIKSLIDRTEIEINSNTGNLLNVFFSYDRFSEIFKNSNSITDLFNSVLSTIQSAMLGLCNLELQGNEDAPGQKPLEIVDRKIFQPSVKTGITSEKPTIHRFKIGAKESIVKNFTFNMEMSTLMQAQALYSTQLAIANANKKTGTEASKEIDSLVSADLSYATNADGYCSVNDMEVSIVKKATEKEKKRKKLEEDKKDQEATKSEAAKKARQEELNKEEKEKKEAAAEEIKKLNESINSKSIKFRNGKNIQNLIYTDSGLVQLYLMPKTPSGSSALTFLEITLEIDGISGFSCGEYFQIDGLPEIYNKNGYFQILNVKQGIDETGWKTTIEAGYLLKTE